MAKAADETCIIQAIEQGKRSGRPISARQADRRAYQSRMKRVLESHPI